MFKTVITEVTIRKHADGSSKVRAFADIILNGAFAVRGLTLLEDQDRDDPEKSFITIRMPNRKLRDGEYKDTAHPINDEMRKAVVRHVLDAFKAAQEATEPVVTVRFEMEKKERKVIDVKAEVGVK